MKKILTFLLAAVMVVGTAAGCTSSGGGTSGKDADGEYTFNVFTNRVQPDPNSQIMQEVQKQLGCKIKVTAVPDTNYDTQLNLLIAGGNTPDIYGSGYLTQTTLKAAATITPEQLQQNCPEIWSDFQNKCQLAGLEPDKKSP